MLTFGFGFEYFQEYFLIQIFLWQNTKANCTDIFCGFIENVELLVLWSFSIVIKCRTSCLMEIFDHNFQGI